MTNAESGQKHEAVDLDQILVDEIGQFGKYQILTLLLAAFPIMFSAFAAGEYIFTTARINTRCLIPQCDSANPEFAPAWVLNAIPGTSPTSFDACNKYANSTNQPPVTEGTCPANLFDTSRTLACSDYVYEDQLSVVYDFDMACDEWRRSQIGSIRTIGTLLVLPVTGYISDRWGRRVALTINAFNTGWLGLVRSFVNSYEWFLALEVIESTIGAGAYSSCFILGYYGLSLFLYLFGKYCIAIVMTSVYVYTAELYPTQYRHNLFAYSSMVGRIGSISAPLTPALALEVWESFPSVLFGSFALISGMLIFTTPETLGTKLPDTMKDAEELGRKKAEVK